MLNSLRPENFSEFIGQARLVTTLQTIIGAAIKQRRQPDHMLFSGASGIGKTSLAHVVACVAGRRLKFVQGPLLERKADMLALFASIAEGDMLLIDEIHGINRSVEELLYSALDDGEVDVVIGVEGELKVMRMKLPPFTAIGATTKIGRLSLPLRNRFGFVGQWEQYTDTDVSAIITQAAQALGIAISHDAVTMLASYAHHVPRVGNNLLRRSIDFMVVKGLSIIDVDVVIATLHQIGLHQHGLNNSHLLYLKNLATNDCNQWFSLATISGMVAEEPLTIVQEIEPPLMTLGFMEKSSRGRHITTSGRDYLQSKSLLAK